MPVTPMPSRLRPGQTPSWASPPELTDEGLTGPHSSRFPVARPCYVLMYCAVSCGAAPSRHAHTAHGTCAQERVYTLSGDRYVAAEPNPLPSSSQGRCCTCTRYSMHERHGAQAPRHPGDRSHPLDCRELRRPNLSIWVVLACHIFAAPTRDGMVQHGICVGIAIIGALAYMGAAPEGALQLQLPAFAPPPPPAWHLAAPRLGDTATLRPHSARLPGWGAQPASREIQDTQLQLALPSISGLSFLIPLRPQPNRKDRGPSAQPLPLLPQYHSTALRSKPCGQGWVWGKRILLVYFRSRCTHECLPLARRPQAAPAASPEIQCQIPCEDPLPCSSQAPFSRRRLSAACDSPSSRLGAVVVAEGGGGHQKSWPTLLSWPPVSLSLSPKNPLWKSVCAPDTSLTTQTSLTGRESLNFTSALVTDGGSTARAPPGHGDQLTCIRIGDSSGPTDPIRWGQRHK